MHSEGGGSADVMRRRRSRVRAVRVMAASSAKLDRTAIPADSGVREREPCWLLECSKATWRH